MCYSYVVLCDVVAYGVCCVYAHIVALLGVCIRFIIVCCCVCVFGNTTITRNSVLHGCVV